MSVKRSVSVAIHDVARPGMVLLVQRPDDDDELPGVWGLPAASLMDGEAWQEAVLRAGRDKLGVDLVVEGQLQQGLLQRASYELEMRLFAAGIAAGSPRVPQDVSSVTQYQAWRWGHAIDLRPAADCGSLCSRLYLNWLRSG